MYRKKDVLLTGFALFAMLFGAGNLIFPPIVGYNAGTEWKAALFGFFITGIGLPLMAIISAALAGDKIDNFGERVSPKFSKIFNIILILAIGPLLALPRTGATAFEMALNPHIHNNIQIIKPIFLGIYFLISLLFSLKSNKVVDRVGKILTPILLIILSLIIWKGVSSPIGVPIISENINNFKYGFFNGYQTMDTLGAIVFSSIILKSIRQGRSLNKKQEMNFLIKSSTIALIALTIVYGGLLYIGATSGGVLPNTGATNLLSDIIILLLGKLGIISLGICVAGACLTTAVGLTATVGEYFSKLLRISYEKTVIITTIVGFIFSNFGVNTIVKISAPILIFLYPIAIVLIFLNIMKKYIPNEFIFKGAVLGSGIVGFIEMINSFGLKIYLFEKIYLFLPFSDFGLAWLIPTLITSFIFNLFFKKSFNFLEV